MPLLFLPRTTPLFSIEHHLTELYVFIDDFLTARPALAHWRQSPHDEPAFADAEVLTTTLPCNPDVTEH